MKSIAHPAPEAASEIAPKAHGRNLALDRARTFLTVVVVIHHAVIPYTYFGHTDPTSWIGFDMVVLANDSFFMAMFFFLSGLFVWPGLGHKEPLTFLRERLLRLGLPFAVAALTVIPLAYYALALRQMPGDAAPDHAAADHNHPSRHRLPFTAIEFESIVCCSGAAILRDGRCAASSG